METIEPGGASRATGGDHARGRAAFEEIEVDAPLVGIIMGSKNDKPKMQPPAAALHEAGSPTRCGC